MIASTFHRPVRLPVLDGLRAISILLVLAAHMLPLGPKILRLNDAAGGMGMSLFFALSGFLITSTLLQNDSTLEFIVRRMSRIIPLAFGYAFVVFTLVFFDVEALFWTLSFVVNYFPAHFNAYNAHFWSLCVEVQFYCAIALVVATTGKKGISIVWPACLLVTAMRVSEGAYSHIQTHLRVDEILAGACVATLYMRASRWHVKHPTILLCAATLLWFAASSPHSGWVQYLRPYASASVLALTLCLGATKLSAVLRSRPAQYVAAISYALYVIHPVTVQGWWNQGAPLEKYLLKRPISFAATFLAAHISTSYWERHWTSVAKSWIRQQRERSLA